MGQKTSTPFSIGCLTAHSYSISSWWVSGFRSLSSGGNWLFGRCCGDGAVAKCPILPSKMAFRNSPIVERSLAGTTGIEPAISRSTILHVNQATPRPHILFFLKNYTKKATLRWEAIFLNFPSSVHKWIPVATAEASKWISTNPIPNPNRFFSSIKVRSISWSII